MATSISNLSSLLHPSLSIKTGLQTAELSAEQSAIVNKKLNERLQSEVARIQGVLLTALPAKQEVLKQVFEKISAVDFKTLTDKKMSEVIAGSVSEEDRKKFTDEEWKQLNNIISTRDTNSNIRSLLFLDVPLNKNPLLTNEILTARTAEIGKVAGIKPEAIARITERNIAIDRIDESALDELVKDNLITAPQKDELITVSRLGLVSGGNADLITAFREKNIKSPVDLISIEKDDLVKLITDKKIALPADEDSAESYAQNILETVESSFPTEFFLHKTINRFPDTELTKLSATAEPLLKKNLKLFDGDFNQAASFSDEDLKDVPANKRPEVVAGVEALRPMVNTYRYLGIADVLSGNTTVDQKKAEVTKRVNALNTFYKNNPDLDIENTRFDVDLAVKSNDSLNWKDIDAATRPLVQKQMAAFQRTYVMGSNQKNAEKLLAGGFDSALRITSLSEEDFIQRSGLDITEGRKAYKTAADLALGASHYFSAIRDSVKNVYNTTNASNQYPLVNDLKEIDGFDQLFGNQDFCDCEHCRSVLGPAAYFCDMMYFVQENISKKVFTGSNANHPLYLKRRRPDLWTLTLTCDHTSTEIPYLEVVNKVLQTYLQTELAIPDVYEHLKTADRSVNQPFNLSLEELRLYLSHFGLSLYDVYKEMQSAIKEQHREKMKLSPAQLSIITTPDTAGVKKRFGNKALAAFNVQEFIGYANITRRQLDDLLSTTFIPDISQVKVKTIKDPTDIQKYSEQLDNLTDARLDFIHRYLRLWKKTSWTLREFDLLLNALKSKTWLNNLEEANAGYQKVLQLAQLMIFQDRLGAGVEELATITFQLPEIAIVDNQTPFASRVFDLTKINDATVTDKIPYVIAGIGITEAELQALAPKLNVNLAQPFTIPVLSNLYRHTRIARGLKWTIEDFIFAMDLVLGGQLVQSFDDIQKLIDFSDWLQKTPLKIADIIFILQGTENSTNQYKNTLDTLSAKVLEIQTQEAVVKEGDAAAKLAMKRNLLRDSILSSFNITADQLDNQFLTLVANSFTNASATALNTTFTNEIPDQPADFNDLLDLLHKLERYNLLFTKHELTPDNITYIINNKAVFGIADIKALTLADLNNISLYREIMLLNTDNTDKLQDALTAFQASNNFTGHEQSLADIFTQPLSLIASVLNNTALAVPAMDAARDFWSALKLCEKLGIQGDSLTKLIASDYKVASGVALGAFSSKYPDVATRTEKLTPYTDKLHSLKRDALCDYIISREDKFKFKDLTDLYAFFLLDVEMSGCFRTSYIVAAITSLQLYVMRCLTNLEASDNNLNPAIPNIKVLPTWIPVDEWEWRKNYRVWEANRKVFLYAENYIDPTLRDTKTHIFKELEDELLQQKITRESAETAYKKYMAGFTELTRLRYAGAYYNAVYDNYGFASLGNGLTNNFFFINAIYFPSESDDSCYYLFARTNVMPYQYFYRTYNHKKETWGNWTKIELGIEAKEISSLIHQGKLYIFWTEAKNKEMNSVSGGDTTSAGFIFTGYVKYSYLTENGKWTAPQRLTLGQDHNSAQQIYGRGRDTTVFNGDRWEKEKDAIVEAFQEKVFRKPYSHSRKTDIATPIGLGFIWSNNKGVSNVKYTTSNTNYSASVSGFKIKFSIPSRSFTVVNNDFSQASADVNVAVKLEVFTVSISQNVTGHIKMQPGICLFSLSIAGLDIVLSLAYSAVNTGGAIKESMFRVSLSRNLITNPADNNLFNGNTLNYYDDEYNVAYSENGDLVHYIENGSIYMSHHKISQNKEGLGGIHIYNNNTYHFVSANTILTDELADILYAKGVEEFLSLKTQEMTDTTGNQLDFRGPYGEYYWEIFFHIPFLIANHFNANQKFEEAKWWYERIFNPTAEETPASTKPTDHNWQFREFRGLTPQKLKDILTDVKAIEVYKKDPFDPHAIARLRISAYQKSIVMKYIDNLMDWGDYLFTQDTRESINEAEMLYRLALNILGKRPVKTGKCDTANENTLTYEKVGPQIANGSEFLITLENVYMVQKNDYQVGVGIVKNSKSLAAAFGMQMKEVNFSKLTEQASIKRLTDVAKKMPAPARPPVEANVNARAATDKILTAKSYNDRAAARIPVKDDRVKWGRTETTRDPQRSIGNLTFKKNKRYPSYDVVKQCCTVFCVPENSDLIKYWDRVEDRLFKIWNCMNIRGIRRSLSLFQPPIDPMMLVRLRAAGLSLEDILAIILNAAKIPNYRFSYLVEKAKQYAQLVQGFGTSLLAALEKKDVEELLLLRTTHEKNILRLTKEIKKNQVKEAKNQYQAAVENLATVQNRIDYYQGLVDTGLIPWEITEQVAKWTAGSIRITEATFGFLASVFGFLPQIGSPFAMKYGGQELKNGTKSLQDATGTLAAIADNVAILAGLEAGHQRREQEWKQQLALSQQEYKQVNQMMLAAEVRQAIAEQDLAMHEKNMEQLDELNDFYKNKFTNLGLFNYLASGLNRIYRASYNIAYDLAKLAERAYQFERYDNSFYIQSDNWEFDRAGLLAGDRLLQQLMELEKKYIDTNTRVPEITQSFSLALLDASQLVQLRQTGSCTIKIPEIAFEVFYPGQYRRVIKSVRVSIPCVAGPYTNISARLTLLKGEIEEVENDPLKEIDIAKNTSISTSSANNDAGLFELSFQDERYLPFEGAGAISEWRLELPSMMRSFNYDTIPDVIMHLSYTSLDGDRATAETALSASFMNFATTNGLYRLFSLRYDFPDAFAKLLSQPAQQTEMNIEKIHFPYALSGKPLSITSTKVYLKPKKETTVTVPASLKINGANAVTFAAGDDVALPGATGDTNKIKGGTVSLSGDPVKKWTLDAGNNGLDKNNLDDVLILLKYRI